MTDHLARDRVLTCVIAGLGRLDDPRLVLTGGTLLRICVHPLLRRRIYNRPNCMWTVKDRYGDLGAPTLIRGLTLESVAASKIGCLSARRAARYQKRVRKTARRRAAYHRHRLTAPG